MKNITLKLVTNKQGKKILELSKRVQTWGTEFFLYEGFSQDNKLYYELYNTTEENAIKTFYNVYNEAKAAKVLDKDIIIYKFEKS